MKTIDKNEKFAQRDQLIESFFDSLPDFPEANLNNLPFEDIENEESFSSIPDSGGNYWIVSNEIPGFRLHSQNVPSKIGEDEILYSGKTKQSIRGRIKNHLLAKKLSESIYSETKSGFKVKHSISALSLDILDQHVPEEIRLSHYKDAMSPKSKVAKTKEDLLKILKDQKEREYVENSNETIYYFKNGINVFDSKHSKFKFRVYYLPTSNIAYSEWVENKWREKFGVPALCSNNGR